MSITCPSCGSTATPTIKRCGPHATAYCPECKKYIKHISAREAEDLGAPTPLSINLSGKNLSREEIIQQLQSAMQVVKVLPKETKVNLDCKIQYTY